MKSREGEGESQQLKSCGFAIWHQFLSLLGQQFYNFTKSKSRIITIKTCLARTLPRRCFSIHFPQVLLCETPFPFSNVWQTISEFDATAWGWLGGLAMTKSPHKSKFRAPCWHDNWSLHSPLSMLFASVWQQNCWLCSEEEEEEDFRPRCDRRKRKTKIKRSKKGPLTSDASVISAVKTSINLQIFVFSPLDALLFARKFFFFQKNFQLGAFGRSTDRSLGAPSLRPKS